MTDQWLLTGEHNVQPIKQKKNLCGKREKESHWTFSWLNYNFFKTSCPNQFLLHVWLWLINIKVSLDESLSLHKIITFSSHPISCPYQVFFWLKSLPSCSLLNSAIVQTKTYIYVYIMKAEDQQKCAHLVSVWHD